MSPRLGNDSLRTAIEPLTERQRSVLRALVAAYVGGGAPVSSGMIAGLLSVHLSSASVRNTMVELAELGLIEKRHASAGRVPTDAGMRIFVDHLLGTGELGSYERQTFDRSLDVAPDLMESAPRILYEQTRQLGFLLAPRLDRLTLRSLHFVRLSSERVLAFFVTASGQTQQRQFEVEDVSQAELERMAAVLNERVAERTLAEVRERLEEELATLRHQAGRWLIRALTVGLSAVGGDFGDEAELVLATRLALLDHPEFADPDKLRELLATLETKERLVDLIARVAAGEGVSVALGEELGEPGLRRCALVVAPYASGGAAGAGMLGVIGPSRMDYGRVIPLVDYASRLMSEKLGA